MQLQLHICLICDVICYVLVELTLLGKFINILVCKKKKHKGAWTFTLDSVSLRTPS